MNEQTKQIPRIRDDSDTRALMLGSKACGELRLEAQNVDWRKFLDEVSRYRRQGRNESEIDWKEVLVRCAAKSPAGPKWFLSPAFLDFLSFRRLIPEAISLAVAIILIAFVLFRASDRVSHLNADLEAVRRENEALKQQHTQLRSELERDNQLVEQSQQRLAGEQSVSDEKLNQLQAANRKPKPKMMKRSSIGGEFIAIRDTSGEVTIRRDGSVSLPEDSNPPPHLARLVSELATKGWVTNTESALGALEGLRSGETRGRLRSPERESFPLPISPLLSAIRSTRPTLRWKALTPTAQYVVSVAYPEQRENGRVIWRSAPTAASEITLPSDLLRRGEVYLWQVEAVAAAGSGLSPAVGFWVLSDAELREMEAAERSYKNSELMLAAIYEAHGLYEDALTRVARLLEMNPTSPFVQAMFQRLRSQLNRE